MYLVLLESDVALTFKMATVFGSVQNGIAHAFT
jgi:hypothetical protein